MVRKTVFSRDGFLLSLAAVLLLSVSPMRATADPSGVGTITTAAGTGEQGYSGDGGPATEAQLSSPIDVAVDGAGNLYIVEVGNRRVRKVDSTGTITTVAGTGEEGFSGDGGPATEAQLSSVPTDVAADGAGNLYIADQFNHRVRKVDSTGTITTVAGTGEEGFSGDGGPATEAQLSKPYSVAVDGAGNLYVAEQGNHRVRKVDSTGTITTIAGTGEQGFSGDGGPATEAQLSSPTDLAADGAGNLYVAEQSNHRVRKVDSTGTITTVAGTGEGGYSGDGGPATEAQLSDPVGVAVDGTGSLYIASFHHRVRKVDSTGTITTVAGTGEQGYSGDGGPATEAQLFYSYGLAVDGADRLYIADLGNHRVRILVPARLDFAHFANGDSIVSDLVFVNVASHPIRPSLYFYDQEGSLIAADSVVDIMGDLMVQEDGRLTVGTEVKPLGDLTISTHGRGELVTGSVKVVAGGPLGGVLRFDAPAIGVAGVGASPPMPAGVFPARRQVGGINTGAAIRNLEADPMTVTCHLMQKGEVLDEAEVPLEANGQAAKFIDELFTETDTSDFVGTVRCSAPDEGQFTGVALEMDPGNRIFTTLPVIPVRR